MKHKLPKRMRTYLKEQEACCKSSTVAGYHINLRCFFEYLKTSSSDKNPLASLTKKHVHDYLLHLCSKDLAPYTKVNYLLAIKKYLLWEANRGKIPEELPTILDRAKLPPVPEYLPRPLSAENDHQLLEILRKSDNVYAPLFLLLRLTGLRISELINLPPDCVITGSQNEKYLKVPLGKMNNERLVPLCDESLTLIEKIRACQNKRISGSAPVRLWRFKGPCPLGRGAPGIASSDQHLRCPQDREPCERPANDQNPDRLIGMKGSIPRVYHQLSRHFKKMTAHMTDQNKPVTFHRLRHTLATALLTGGVSLPSLMKLLGHKRIEMTLRYAKVTPNHLRDEYLRAIRILEKQSALVKTKSEIPGQLLPEEVIQQLTSFLSTAALIPSRNKKNLLLKLTRLRNTLADIPLSKNFTLHEYRDNSLSRLAG